MASNSPPASRSPGPAPASAPGACRAAFLAIALYMSELPAAIAAVAPSRSSRTRRRQDDADRKAAAVRRRHPAGRRGQGARRPPRATRSDWMKIERERGISVVTSVMTFEYERLRLQPARHAGPRGLLRRHLPHADGGRFGGHGHRRRQGHRAADAQAVRGLPPARHSDHHLHQQDGPRGARSVRPARRDRAEAGARRRRPTTCCRPAGADRARRRRPHLQEAEVCQGLDDPKIDGRPARERRPSCATTSRWRAACASRSTSTPTWRGPPDAGLLRLGVNNFGVRELLAGLARLAPPPRPQPARRAPVEPASPRSRASSSRSRRTWIPSTATASPSCAWPRATSAAA
jgi:hypothetical protein